MLAFELKSYDLRQNINLKQKLVNPNIVILAIDDNSLEILEKKAEALVVTVGELFRSYVVPTGIFDDVFAEKKAKKTSSKMMRGE